jgi:hypothetical protein
MVPNLERLMMPKAKRECTLITAPVVTLRNMKIAIAHFEMCSNLPKKLGLYLR